MSYKPIDSYLGRRLQELREQRGLSMSAVGRQIGTTYQQVRKYETGENRISASTLYRLAQLFGVEVNEFFQGLPGRMADGGARSDADPIGMGPALEKIADPEVRQHLTGLLQALGGRR